MKYIMAFTHVMEANVVKKHFTTDMLHHLLSFFLNARLVSGAQDVFLLLFSIKNGQEYIIQYLSLTITVPYGAVAWESYHIIWQMFYL